MKNEGCDVLRLPPYHCDLIATQNIWVSVKTTVVKKNMKHQAQDMVRLMLQPVEEIASENRKATSRHVNMLLPIGSDCLMDEEVEPVLISHDVGSDKVTATKMIEIWIRSNVYHVCKNLSKKVELCHGKN